MPALKSFAALATVLAGETPDVQVAPTKQERAAAALSASPANVGLISAEAFIGKHPTYWPTEAAREHTRALVKWCYNVRKFEQDQVSAVLDAFYGALNAEGARRKAAREAANQAALAVLGADIF